MKSSTIATLPYKTSQGWKNVLQIIIPYLIFAGCFQLIGALISGLDLEKYNEATTWQLFIIHSFGLMGTFLVIWIFRVYVDKQTFSSIGFQGACARKDILTGLISGLLLMLFGFAVLVLTHQLSILNIRFGLWDFLLSIGVFIFAATSEEILMRGYILNNLMVSFKNYTALIISAIIFSLAHSFNNHLNLIGYLSLFISGLLLGLPYIYTKRLWFSIALHFSWNFFQGTIFGFNVSGKSFYSVISLKENVHNIWNGGEFGFEGSLLSVIFQVILLIILYLALKNGRPERRYTSGRGK